MADDMTLEEYDAHIERMRQEEYPMLKTSLYLDHAGTTLYSRSLMERFHADMMANLYGNPHSASPSSQLSTREIESVRLQSLRFLNADPDHFDLVFTANTTAAIKLVMEAFRDQQHGFSYGYHVESHTSLVGVRESARSHICLTSDDDVAHWLSGTPDQGGCKHRLFAYPAQSNLNGCRLPRTWSATRGAHSTNNEVYTLLDAAAYAATSPLHFDHVDSAPDFTVVSFSKMFGFPDLGALVVKKNTAHLFEHRRYFGGGTVEMVACVLENWHALKSGSIHERLEDGTPPVHSIIALRSAINTHGELFRSLDKVSRHVSALAKELYDGLQSLRHSNGKTVCHIHTGRNSNYNDPATQGPTVAFNLLDSQGRWLSNTEAEKLAIVKDIHLRTGGLCNPGGVATCLNLAPWEIRENFSAGFRCGSEDDIVNGKPTGVIRASLGAVSTTRDVARFIDFVREFFVDDGRITSSMPCPLPLDHADSSRFCVESLTVYPIKSCGGWRVPYGTGWDVRKNGLAWDREWCIVDAATGAALSQKKHSRMALIRPELDLKQGVLRVRLTGSTDELVVPLSKEPSYLRTADFKTCNASVCGDSIEARIYTSEAIAKFFTSALGVPCTLARFPASTQATHSTRHCKAHLQQPGQLASPSILLSNESPILVISSSSLNRLNEAIKTKGGKAVHAAAFRANIVLSESPSLPPGQEQPWAEDEWQNLRIGGEQGPVLDLLGGCRRCQMVCIDQETGSKNQEPFVTLAKIRRIGGRVLFGVHTCLAEESIAGASIRAGDAVQTWLRV